MITLRFRAWFAVPSLGNFQCALSDNSKIRVLSENRCDKSKLENLVQPFFSKLSRPEVAAERWVKRLQIKKSLIHVEHNRGIHQQDLSGARTNSTAGRESLNHFLSLKGDTPHQYPILKA